MGRNCPRTWMLLLIFVPIVSGCLYRGEGVFKKIGDSDYKARINLMNMFVVADGRPTYVSGTVLLEDHITPLKNTPVVLKKKAERTVISKTQTDHTGNFTMSGILAHGDYLIEIDSPEYSGDKEITVEPNKQNCHEIIAHKSAR